MSGDEPKKTSFWKQRLTRHVPVLSWIRNYKKSDFVADMIAGITLGLTLIPQSVAYAALAGVSAEVRPIQKSNGSSPSVKERVVFITVVIFSMDSTRLSWEDSSTFFSVPFEKFPWVRPL